MQADTNKKVDFIQNLTTPTQPNLTYANGVLSKINFFVCFFRLYFHFQHIKKTSKISPEKNQYYEMASI